MSTSIAGFHGSVNHRSAAASAGQRAAVGAARTSFPRVSGQELARPVHWRAEPGPNLADGLAGALLYGALVLLVAALA